MCLHSTGKSQNVKLLFMHCIDPSLYYKPCNAYKATWLLQLNVALYELQKAIVLFWLNMILGFWVYKYMIIMLERVHRILKLIKTHQNVELGQLLRIFHHLIQIMLLLIYCNILLLYYQENAMQKEQHMKLLFSGCKYMNINRLTFCNS